ncbi:carbon storage regulator [Marinobacter subterrani]|uniref:Carbon storage regulator, CsrA n=1 Tax=Marinobacter subterrani TaxID=1658765 RepID=A0A0J7JBJ1_9GAMM|nr:carbon storage regulator [Marinobacter subterrani]KMQ75269.1 carbon storage regulator, CsrA [Marinobacter subterrani]
MLILTRRPGEALVMETESGETIKVVVIDNRGAQVRMGVIASQKVSVDREEIHLRKRREKAHA